MLPLLCLLLPASAWAGTYYVSSSSGEDTAAGTSPSAPWRTLAKAGTQALRPGDSLLLRQGDSWIVETGRSRAPRRLGHPSAPSRGGSAPLALLSVFL